MYLKRTSAHSVILSFVLVVLFACPALADECQSRCGLTCSNLRRCEITDTHCICKLETGKVVGIVLGVIGGSTVIKALTKKASDNTQS